MTISRTHPRRRFGRARLPALLLLVGATGSVLAYRHLFNRPGETAIQMIPADAMVVATLDTNPSPQQVVTFKRIEDALKREQADLQIDKGLTSALQDSSLGKELRPQLKTDCAFAGWEKDCAGIVAVKHTDEVRAILAKYGRQGTQSGLEYYKVRKPDMVATERGEYLVCANKPRIL